MDWLWNQIRVCPRCGKSWGNFEWLCDPCEAWFLSKLKLKCRWISKQMVHYYLIDWERGDELSHLVYSLKGGGRLKTMEMVTLFFEGFPKNGGVYYPSSGKKDHAFELSLALAGGNKKRLRGISKLGSEKQSFLTKNERKKRGFEPLNRASKEPHFVDDIVTSGGTALGCWRALGQPSKMTVWSLFYRKSL